MRGRNLFIQLGVLIFLTVLPAVCMGQAEGTLRGKVIFEESGGPVHNATIRLTPSRRQTATDNNGVYEFQRVPVGRYTILVHMEGFPDVVQTVQVTAGGVVTTDFRLTLTPIREEVTVTASGREQTTFDAIQSVVSLDAIQLVDKLPTSLGEALEYERGVSKRSFGPGSARPVIRGFEGDRVLVLQDGLRTGSLGSQSGDHGEPIDVLSLERIEIVKGPATLLYGSNAIGGVVNSITGQSDVPDKVAGGFRGFLTGTGGTTSNLAGFGAGLEYGAGNWLVWGNGGAQRTGDYDTPLGSVINSRTRSANFAGGFGYYRDRGFFTGSYGYDRRRYGVPFAAQFEAAAEDEGEEPEGEGAEEQVSLLMKRQNVRFSGGFRSLNSFISGFRVQLDYSDYQHQELEGTQVGTVFNNNQFVYRGVFDQRGRGRLSGTFGFWGMRRDYESIGEETLAPPVIQNSFAVFGLQELDFERVRFQFGGRLETNRYSPVGQQKRNFTGFSGAVGLRVPLWTGGAFVFNYTHSYRAPALEELYNDGPHIGNLTFEIGNPNLRRERGDGLDFSLRQSSRRVRAEANFFYYRLKDFVFLAPRDEDSDGIIDIEEGLIVAEYFQANSRYVGAEIGLELELHRYLWLNAGFDAVDAQLTQAGTPLPRIPPARGRIGFDFRYEGLSLRPEAVLVKDQDQLFPTETRTAGYALFNLRGSYTILRQHYIQVFSVSAFNLGNRLYRNHLSFIKELTPEIGRGVRFTYTIRLY